MEFNVCVIGCGFMGKMHAEAWHKREDSKVASIYNPSPERAKATQEMTGGTIHNSYQEAILHEGVNIISICAPTCYHQEIACFAMENGRHVITEKPIALTLEQADTMIETAKKHKVKLAVSHQYRDIPRHRRYRHLVQSNAFGGPIFVHIVDIREVRPKIAMHRQSVNGGPVIDLGVHYYDAIRFYTGEEPESVLAKGHIFGKGKKRLVGLSDLAIDAAEVLVSMSGGHTLSLFVNWGMPEGFPTISYELLSGPQLSIQYNNDVVIANYPDHKQTWNDFRGNLFSPDLRIYDFVCSIKENHDPDVSGHEARKALRVGCAALESMKTGQVVKL